jgi:hypothetical protein
LFSISPSTHSTANLVIIPNSIHFILCRTYVLWVTSSLLYLNDHHLTFNILVVYVLQDIFVLFILFRVDVNSTSQDYFMLVLLASYVVPGSIS